MNDVRIWINFERGYNKKLTSSDVCKNSLFLLELLKSVVENLAMMKDHRDGSWDYTDHHHIKTLYTNLVSNYEWILNII